MRKPPSVVLAAIALEAGPVNPSLVDEVISVANAIRNKLAQKNASTRMVTVCNPAYPQDVFTDRWPETERAQAILNSSQQGFVLTEYFYEALIKFEKDPAGLRNAYGDLVSNIDLRKEQKRAAQITFASSSDPLMVIPL